MMLGEYKYGTSQKLRDSVFCFDKVHLICISRSLYNFVLSYLKTVNQSSITNTKPKLFSSRCQQQDVRKGETIFRKAPKT